MARAAIPGAPSDHRSAQLLTDLPHRPASGPGEGQPVPQAGNSRRRRETPARERGADRGDTDQPVLGAGVSPVPADCRRTDRRALRATITDVPSTLRVQVRRGSAVHDQPERLQRSTRSREQDTVHAEPVGHEPGRLDVPHRGYLRGRSIPRHICAGQRHETSPCCQRSTLAKWHWSTTGQPKAWLGLS